MRPIPGSTRTATLVGVTAYGLSLTGRLRRLPIEHAKLSSTLPIAREAVNRAKLAWTAGWWAIFVLVPGAFAVVRQASAGTAGALLAGATVLVIVTAAVRR